MIPAFVGSNPTSPALYGILAQLVEHLTFNQVVGGSNPPCLIIIATKAPRVLGAFCFLQMYGRGAEFLRKIIMEG